jgi:hypothetical protein
VRDIQFRVWHRGEKKMYYRGYQKWFYVLLCDDDLGTRGGRGLPVCRASYEDCIFFESTGVFDVAGREVFEGDFVRVTDGHATAEGLAGGIPDMFKSRGLHPLHSLLERAGISDKTENLRIEVLGNLYEHPQLASSQVKAS